MTDPAAPPPKVAEDTPAATAREATVKKAKFNPLPFGPDNPPNLWPDPIAKARGVTGRTDPGSNDDGSVG